MSAENEIFLDYAGLKVYDVEIKKYFGEKLDAVEKKASVTRAIPEIAVKALFDSTIEPQTNDAGELIGFKDGDGGLHSISGEDIPVVTDPTTGEQGIDGDNSNISVDESDIEPDD